MAFSLRYLFLATGIFFFACTVKSPQLPLSYHANDTIPRIELRMPGPRIHHFQQQGLLLNDYLSAKSGTPCFFGRLLPGNIIHESLKDLEYRVIHYTDDLYERGRLMCDDYDPGLGVLTFRGSFRRDMPVSGFVRGVPQQVNVDWVYTTDYDTTRTQYGMWGGGLGWTGQPLIVKWPGETREEYSLLDITFKKKQDALEVIAGSLSGTVFFLDFEDGTETRPPIPTHNPIKGTPSLDPRLNGLLYVGSGVPHDEESFGINIIDLHRHAPVFFYSGHNDPVAYRRWGAFDSSPLLVGDFLYWPGENGVLYQFYIDDDEISLVAKMVYRLRGRSGPGIESSLAVYKNYGYFGDNHGNILCINLLTLQPVWMYDNMDDTDATIVIEVEDEIPYIYTGSQVDMQGDEGYARFVKINGLNGEALWEQKIEAFLVSHAGRMFDGGMFSTPLAGRNNAADIIVSNFAHTTEDGAGELIAFHKQTGDIVYRTLLSAYSWSSPVALYNEFGDLFIFTGDVEGNVYLLDGRDGRILYRRRLGRNFEASPVVWGNRVVIGSRGREIYRLSIE